MSRDAGDGATARTRFEPRSVNVPKWVFAAVESEVGPNFGVSRAVSREWRTLCRTPRSVRRRDTPLCFLLGLDADRVARPLWLEAEITEEGWAGLAGFPDFAAFALTTKDFGGSWTPRRERTHARQTRPSRARTDVDTFQLDGSIFFFGAKSTRS